MRYIEIPALIDSHVHFRTPGSEHKEDWKSGALAAVRGGVTTVLDMPNNNPSCVTLELLLEKKRLIDAQLRAVGIPLHYGLYLGAGKGHLHEIERVCGEAVAIKVFMGSSTGNLLIDSKTDLAEVFERAARVDMLVAVHAEEESLLKRATGSDPAQHSKIRPREAAICATTKAIEMAARFGTRLHILHMSTKEELELVQQAKKSGVAVTAEATTHHLFLDISDYAKWGTLVQMNPPLRDPGDCEALWEGIRSGAIDTIGTDHAPHLLSEKRLPFGKAPSGIPGIETLLPLLIDAVREKRLTLERMVELTRTNPERIFRLPTNEDTVVIDLEWRQEVKCSELSSKAGWSPYEGRSLQGWPLVTKLGKRKIIIRGKVEGKPRTLHETCLGAHS